jgi:hypothetical protein
VRLGVQRDDCAGVHGLIYLEQADRQPAECQFVRRGYKYSQLFHPYLAYQVDTEALLAVHAPMRYYLHRGMIKIPSGALVDKLTS